MQDTPYPFEHTITVIFRDIDALGHVNNAVYFTYLETTRFEFWTALMGQRKLENLSTILAEATCTYKSPAYLNERLTIGIGVSRIGNKSFDLDYRIQAEDGRLVATARTVQVNFDYKTQQPTPVPEVFKVRVHTLQGDWKP